MKMKFKMSGVNLEVMKHKIGARKKRILHVELLLILTYAPPPLIMSSLKTLENTSIEHFVIIK